MDLAEAPRIAGGGAGLDGAARFEQLAAVASALGAATGATRVVTDRHWVRHERQIGTTGVVVDPQLYLAFGISGAVQHTSGLGNPDHIVSVNTDPHCPMMQLADLAIVADANAVIAELADRLAVSQQEPPS
jgi:electron transfer flavoprotein alpha subunit